MKKTFVKQITCTILIYIKMIYAQVSQLDFRQVQMPNNMLRITQEKTAGISSQIECAAWCLVNSASKDNCTAYHYQEEQDQRCECGDPYCYDDIKELDPSEIKAHVDVKCKRPLLPTPPGNSSTSCQSQSEIGL